MFSYFVLSSVDKKTELTLLFKGQNETQAGCLSDLSCLTPLYLAKVLDLYHAIVLPSKSLISQQIFEKFDFPESA